MESIQERMKKLKSEELIQRFRSKEDIYKYLTVQSKDNVKGNDDATYSGIVFTQHERHQVELFESNSMQ